MYICITTPSDRHVSGKIRIGRLHSHQPKDPTSKELDIAALFEAFGWAYL